MDQIFCQSCAMPMGETNELYGSNKDGSKNQDYCKYCFSGGEFTVDCTLESMMDFCVPHVMEAHPGMSREEAKSSMATYFPELKRWKKSD